MAPISSSDSKTSSRPDSRASARPDGKASARPRSTRSHGQWKIDGTTPLNANEEFKAADSGLNVRERILSTYAKEGFDSIPHDDLFGRFRWWGLYTQRKQDFDGGRTGQVSDEELADKYFMLRVRVDGLALNLDQIRTLGTISTEFARSSLDISDRQNIQYHWIRIEDVPEIWRRLDEVGLDSNSACGDVPRAFLASPVAGVAAEEIIDPTPLVHQLREKYLGDPAFANLPRKFKTAITGHPSLDVVHEVNDISFVGVRHPELGAGYDLWVGGGLSTAPHLAQRLGTFVTEEQAPEVWAGVVSIFRDYGYRRLRNKARLKYLVADWGAEKFRQVLQDEYLGYQLPDGPAAVADGGAADHIGVHDQKDGRKYIGFAGTAGRLGGEQFTRVAEFLEAAGSTRATLTPHQKLVALDVDPDKVDQLIADMATIGMYANPSPWRRSTMACTGIEYCKLAFVETKSLAASTVDELEKRFEGEDVPPISLNINGCPNSCVRIQTADIGLKGQRVKGEFGFQVHLGGGLASTDREEPGLGRTVRGLKVTADDLPDYVERVTRRYLDQRTSADETFSQWVARSEDEEFA